MTAIFIRNIEVTAKTASLVLSVLEHDLKSAQAALFSARRGNYNDAIAHCCDKVKAIKAEIASLKAAF